MIGCHFVNNYCLKSKTQRGEPCWLQAPRAFHGLPLPWRSVLRQTSLPMYSLWLDNEVGCLEMSPSEFHYTQPLSKFKKLTFCSCKLPWIFSKSLFVVISLKPRSFSKNKECKCGHDITDYVYPSMVSNKFYVVSRQSDHPERHHTSWRDTGLNSSHDTHA